MHDGAIWNAIVDKLIIEEPMEDDPGQSGYSIRELLDQISLTFLRAVRIRLDEIVGIARAAEICAEIGKTDKAVGLLLDIELPFRRGQKLRQRTASMINRLWNH